MATNRGQGWPQGVGYRRNSWPRSEGDAPHLKGDSSSTEWGGEGCDSAQGSASGHLSSHGWTTLRPNSLPGCGCSLASSCGILSWPAAPWFPCQLFWSPGQGVLLSPQAGKGALAALPALHSGCPGSLRDFTLPDLPEAMGKLLFSADHSSSDHH